MSLIFLFVDGVGLGEEDSSNPFFTNCYEAFRTMCGGVSFTKNAVPVDEVDHVFRAVDATLGIQGLPQSGTGQTSLFTGVNAARVIGKHFGPFPHSGIKYLLREQSLFNKAQRLGKSIRFANAYPNAFFRKARRRNRWSCTTVMSKSAGIPLFREEDIKKGSALAAELTQQAWRELLGIDVPVISPETAADRLLKLAEDSDLVLSEYYLTDKAGHEQNQQTAAEVLSVYDRFLIRLIRNKRNTDTLVLCSDHGNLEDLSVKTHTRHRVPLFVYGPGSETFAQAESILDVTPAITNLLDR